jgi:hypothetical protein
MSVSDSDDLTQRVVIDDGLVAFLVSPPTAEHHPDYRIVAAFPVAISAT